MRAAICRYPEDLFETEISLDETVEVTKGKSNPLFIKVVQSDGHIAWSSPVYVNSV